MSSCQLKRDDERKPKIIILYASARAWESVNLHGTRKLSDLARFSDKNKLEHPSSSSVPSGPPAHQMTTSFLFVTEILSYWCFSLIKNTKKYRSNGRPVLKRAPTSISIDFFCSRASPYIRRDIYMKCWIILFYQETALSLMLAPSIVKSFSCKDIPPWRGSEALNDWSKHCFSCNFNVCRWILFLPPFFGALQNQSRTFFVWAYIAGAVQTDHGCNFFPVRVVCFCFLT